MPQALCPDPRGLWSWGFKNECLRENPAGAQGRPCGPSVSNSSSRRGQTVLETSGCHAPGGCVGALTSCKFRVGCHQSGRELLHRWTHRLGRGWSLSQGSPVLTDAGASLPLPPLSLQRSKLQEAPQTTVMWRGSLLQARLMSGLLWADSQQDWCLLTPKAASEPLP